MPRGARTAVRLRQRKDEALGLLGHGRGGRWRRTLGRSGRSAAVLCSRAGADVALGFLRIVAPRRRSLILFGRGFNAHRLRSGGGLGSRSSSVSILFRGCLVHSSCRPLFGGGASRGLGLGRSLGREIFLSGPPVGLRRTGGSHDIAHFVALSAEGARFGRHGDARLLHARAQGQCRLRARRGRAMWGSASPLPYRYATRSPH